MQGTLKTFTSGAGDCIVLLLQLEQQNFSLFVDCGSFTEEIHRYVIDTLNKNIDILIVTHIDNDHVSGIARMLHDIPDLNIGKIIFNSYDRETNEDGIIKLDEKLRTRIEKLRSQLPIYTVKEEESIKAKHALLLSECILSQENWTRVWDTKPYTQSSPNLILNDGDFGELIFLSPTSNELSALEKEFKEEFNKRLLRPLDGKHKEDSEIYELIIRLAETNNYEESEDPVSFGQMTTQMIDMKASNEKSPAISPANKASLAVLWKYNNIGIILLGDSDPEIVMRKLRYINDIDILACKVSHHGSKHNTTIELIEKVNSAHYFFTGGKNEQRPSIEAIAKILKKTSKEHFTLHFNYACNQMKEIEKIPDLFNQCLIDTSENQITFTHE